MSIFSSKKRGEDIDIGAEVSRLIAKQQFMERDLQSLKDNVVTVYKAKENCLILCGGNLEKAKEAYEWMITK
jgi:hypothetical protein